MRYFLIFIDRFVWKICQYCLVFYNDYLKRRQLQKPKIVDSTCHVFTIACRKKMDTKACYRLNFSIINSTKLELGSLMNATYLLGYLFLNHICHRFVFTLHRLYENWEKI